MKKSTFVSFSSMIQQSVQSKEEHPVQSEPEVDYEQLYLDWLQEKEQLKENCLNINKIMSRTHWRGTKKR